MKKPISVVHHMARSGGTLISKCLGSMDNIALLSEVHPLVAQGDLNPIVQAREWLGVDVMEVLSARGKPEQISWLDCIAIIHEQVEKQGRHLLIRDWSHLDFTGIPWSEPSYRLKTAEILGRRFELKQLYTVRHPVDQWLSASQISALKGILDVPKFLKGYKAFAEFASKGTFVRFEDFTARPEFHCKMMCEVLELPYDDGFLDKFSSFSKITGDRPEYRAGRAAGDDKIAPLRRRSVEPALLEQFESCDDYVLSLRLLGYDSAA